MPPAEQVEITETQELHSCLVMRLYRPDGNSLKGQIDRLSVYIYSHAIAP